MNTVKKIIESYGGIKWLMQDGNCIRIEKPGYMRLVIEHIGTGAGGNPVISVAHYYEQNGDQMRDPEMTFLVSPKGDWLPMSYLQDSLGVFQEAIFKREDGKWLLHKKLIKELMTFSKQWDKNLREQGFADVPVKAVA